MAAPLVAVAALLCAQLARGEFAANSLFADELPRQTTRHSVFSGGRATLHAVEDFDPVQDSSDLQSALNSEVVDENVIVEILTKRTDAQRQEIIRMYPNITIDLDNKLTLRFKDLMISLTIPIPRYYALQVHQALNTQVDEGILVELLSTLSNAELHAVRKAYRTEFNRTLVHDLASHPRNRLLKYLSFYIKGKRDEMNNVNMDLAVRDAQAMKLSGALRLEKTSKTSFGEIMLSRSFPQLKFMFLYLERTTRRGLESVIKRDFTGNVQTGLLNIVKSIRNRPSYFADRLRSDMTNSSKRDSTLIRVVLTRSEVDMEDIKHAYLKLYTKSLSRSISEKTSGGYKAALLSLINE